MFLSRSAAVTFLLLNIAAVLAQQPPKSATVPAKNPPAQAAALKRNPAIARSLAQVSAKNVQADIEKLSSFHTRHTLSNKVPASSGQGIVAAREWIRSQLEQLSKGCNGCLEVKTYAFTDGPAPRIPQPTEIVDVYAVLQGSDAESAKRIIVISGHYDTIASAKMTDAEVEGPGANDDASGTSVVLESARTFSKMAADGVKFPATFVFVAFAAEEQGLNGSRGFAKMAKSEGWKIEAVLNNDIVGGDRSAGQNPSVVRVFSEGIPYQAIDNKDATTELRLVGLENDSPSRQLARYIVATGAAYAKDGVVKPRMIYRQDRYLRGGDHTSFNQQGYAAVRFTEFRENFNHQHQIVRTENGIEYGDLPKFVDFDYVARVARLNIATAAALASAPAAPAQVRIDAKKLENDTSLSWEPVAGATSYDVLWRDTESPVWERSQSVVSKTAVTVSESKDNVIFGVRAVGADGQKSLVTVPTRETRRQ